MAKELHWSVQRQEEEIDRCIEYMRHFGGPRPTVQPAPDPREAKDADDELRIMLERCSARVTDERSIRRAYHCVDFENKGRIDQLGVRLMGEVLGHPLLEDEISECIFYTVDARHARDKDRPNNGFGSAGSTLPVDQDTGITLEEFVRWWNKDCKGMKRDIPAPESIVFSASNEIAGH
jgi:hypothetical protein